MLKYLNKKKKIECFKTAMSSEILIFLTVSVTMVLLIYVVIELKISSETKEENLRPPFVNEKCLYVVSIYLLH